MSEIRRGALLSYVTILTVNLSGLLLTPLIIRALGTAEYGLYLLIGSLAAYLGILDFGLNNAVTRYVAQCSSTNDRQQEARFLGAAVVVNGIAAITIICVGSVLFANIDQWFGSSLDLGERGQAKIMLLLLIANVVFTITASMFTAISAGHERFSYPKTVNLVRYLLRIALVLVVLGAHGGAVALIALDTSLSFVVLVANAFYALRSLGVRFRFSTLNLKLIREVLGFSAWIFLFAIIGQFQWQTGQVIIGRVSGPESVAVYGVGIMFGTYYGAFSTAITSLFMTRATHLTVSQASPERLASEMTRIGRIALLILLLILGVFTIFGREFLILWAGPDFEGAWLVSITIMLAYTVPLIQSFANQLLEAMGLFKFKARVYLVALPIGIYVGYILLPSHGVLGMAMGIALGWGAAVFVMNVYYHKVINLNMPRFFIGVSRGIAPVFIACLSIGGLLRLIPGSGWLLLFGQISIFSVSYAVLMYRFGMNIDERNEVDNILKRIKWNRA